MTAEEMLGNAWVISRDGSLRNGGVEFVTNGGLGGEALDAALISMHALLAEVPYENTFRCSTHMHINMNDFTVNQVVRFVLAYTACEPYLFAFAGAYRYASNFCTPVAESLPFHKRALSLMTENAIARGGAAKYCNKYTALNLLTLFPDSRSGRALGTVEFRGSRALDTRDEFLQLANLLLSIKQYVRNFSGSDDEFLASINSGVLGTIYTEQMIAGLSVDIETLERAMVNSWLLLKSYQKGMSKPEAPSIQDMSNWQAGYAQLSSAAAARAQEANATILSCLNMWPSRYRTWPDMLAFGPALLTEHGGASAVNAMQRLYGGLWGGGTGRKATCKTMQPFTRANRFSLDGAGVHMTLVGRERVENEGTARPNATALGPEERTEWPEGRHLAYLQLLPENMIDPWLQAVYDGEGVPANVTNEELANYIATKSVRTKNRTALREALLANGYTYTVREQEPITRMKAMMRCAQVDYHDYVWTGDISRYEMMNHAFHVMGSYNLMVPFIAITRTGENSITVRWASPSAMFSKAMTHNRFSDSNERWIERDDLYMGNENRSVENPIYEAIDSEDWTYMY